MDQPEKTPAQITLTIFELYDKTVQIALEVLEAGARSVESYKKPNEIIETHVIIHSRIEQMRHFIEALYKKPL